MAETAETNHMQTEGVRRTAMNAYDLMEGAEGIDDIAVRYTEASRALFGDGIALSEITNFDFDLAAGEAEPAVSLLIPAVLTARETAGGDVDAVVSFGGEGQHADAEVPDGGQRAVQDGQAVLPPLSGAPSPVAAETVVAPTPATSGVNTIHGTNGSNTLHGTDEADFIYGHGGNDRIFGHDGIDFLFGGDGKDGLFGGRGMDFLYGEDHADIVDGGRGNDYLFGGNGGDALYGDQGENHVYGGAGNDTLFSNGGDDEFDGGSGSDTVTYVMADDAVTARLWYAGPQDTGDGTDSFKDIENLTGSSFNDWLSGDSASNTIRGGKGVDRIDGGPGNDALFGEDGADTLTGGTGNDTLDGGDGNDTASFEGSAVGVRVDLSIVFPQNTNQGIDTFISIERVDGSDLGDLIRGNGENNRINGNDGNDWIWGLGGNDNLYGGEGNDVIAGGAGDDNLHGGNGADAFFAGSYFGDGGHDLIDDFESGIDKVFVPIGYGNSDFSDITIGADDYYGFAVATFANGESITFFEVLPEDLGESDFVFF